MFFSQDSKQGYKKVQGLKLYRVFYVQANRSLCQQVLRKVKKLVAIWANFMSMTVKKTEEKLEWAFYIWYPITFKN